MAIPTYTLIPDARLQPDAPVRSVDALALRDNPLAIAQADEADATPQIYEDGIADDAVTTVKILDANVTYAKLGAWYSTAGGLGTYAFLGSSNTTGRTIGENKSESNLEYAGIIAEQSFGNNEPRIYDAGGATTYHRGNGGVPNGTWQCMGIDGSNANPTYGATLYQRVA